jgi:molecular chaperone DnaK
MGRTIGIDLGTTNTAVAVFDKGRPRVLEDDKGYKVLPSVISRKADGSFVVGHAAKARILTHPDSTVYAIKRLVGRRFDSDQVANARRRMPYEISEGSESGCMVSIGGAEMSPVDVSAIVLKVAKQIAERALGEPVDEAVITVPAYFNHSQRSATMEAAELAGLRCDRLLNEPTAAALAYGFRKEVEKNILIFDLGGGTFDVSVLHLSDGVYEVLATSGDTFLGGEDFDSRIVDFFADRFLSEHRYDLRDDKIALQRLKDAAERAKCELSFSERAHLLVPRIHASTNLDYELTRSQLEDLVSDLVDRTIDVARDAVRMAGLSINRIEEVVLVGGQTRMPRVREAISSLFGREPSRSVHPEEVVAVGAAVHAESLNNPEHQGTLLIDVTPFDLGIDSAGGFFSTIIERNTRIPYTQTRVFATASENQDQARITIRQGASRVSSENERLGEFLLTGLGGAARMERKVDVTFRIDANGILHTSAVDRATGERKSLSIRDYSDKASSPTMPSPEEAERDARLAAVYDTGAPAAEKKKGGASKKKGGGLFAGLLAGLGKKKDAKPKADNSKRMDLAPPEDAPAPEPTKVAITMPDAPEPVEVEPEPEPYEGIPEIPDLPDMPAEAFEAEPYEPDEVEADMLAPLGDAYGDDELSALSDEMPLNDPFAGLAEELLGGHDEPEELEPELATGVTPVLSPEEIRRATGMDISQMDLGEPSQGTEDESLRPALLEEDLFYPEDLFGTGESAPAPEPAKPAKPQRKPAKLKISYRSRRAFVREYTENLERGSTFIKAAKPLREGRKCLFEIRVPQVDQPVVLDGMVTWSSRKRRLQLGEQQGMTIEYRLSAEQRKRVEDVLAALSA